MSDFRSDLKNTSFVKSPADAVVDLNEHYIRDLGNCLDRHAPLISRLTNKDSADCMSDDYRRAKSLRRQFERTWHRAKNPLNNGIRFLTSFRKFLKTKYPHKLKKIKKT